MRDTGRRVPVAGKRWPLRPWVLAGEVGLVLAICAIVLLRELVSLSAYDGPSYSVHQVTQEQGFIAWEGEHTAVRGQVLMELAGCGGRALMMVDPHDGAQGPRLTVVFEPQPQWLWLVSSLPAMHVLLPVGLPPHPSGLWTVTGHLTLGWDRTCLPSEGYVLVADSYQ